MKGIKCPRCRTAIHTEGKFAHVVGTGTGTYCTHGMLCPHCQEPIIHLFTRSGPLKSGNGTLGDADALHAVRLIQPLASARPPCPAEVRAEHPAIADDFDESAMVLPLSAKASAALSRRCLQQVLREKVRVNKGDLVTEIDEALPKLSADIGSMLHTLRRTGNWAAHPAKYKSTGEIVPVEPEEAEFCLLVLEALFEELYIHPATMKSLKQQLDAKNAAMRQPLAP